MGARGGGGRTTTGGGSRTAAQDTEAERIAAEARDILRRAAGDVAGLTVAAQVRQAARHLGFPAHHWRPREAWYGRAGTWSPAALDELRQRFASWRRHEAARGAEQNPDLTVGTAHHDTLMQRVHSIRAGLETLRREVEALAAEVERLSG